MTIYLIYKRIQDIALSLVALVILSPVLLIVLVAIKLDSIGPVIFVQRRVGKDGEVFNIRKFRSMQYEMSTLGDIKNGEDVKSARDRFKTTVPNDKRITAVGRVIRKHHIDELPQLLNVLMGEMSLIGPRPDTPSQEADYTPMQWRRRHRVKPGITGLSQLYKSKRGYSHNRRIALDLWYVKTAGFCLDIKLAILTISHIVAGKSF